jgi:hypothetical protein
MRKIISLVLVSALAACGDNTELSGSITATAYGEEFIEEGIPADAFSDGWAVQFDKFLISIGDPKAKAGEGGLEVGDDNMYVVDLAQASGGAGYELATFEAPAGDYDHYGYRIAPSADAIAINAAPADVAAMAAAGYSIWLQGQATQGAVTKTLDWGFALKLGHSHCDADARIREEAVTMQATIHADHFFYDDAVSPEPELAFQLIADSDANGDGAVTLAELASTDIRGETRYQVGSKRDSKGDPIINLAQYLELQATTLGHINGEGHCEDLIIEP